MEHIRRRFVAILMASCLVPLCAHAATTIVIPGTANIFGAGLSAPPPSPADAWNQAHLDQSGPGGLPVGLSFNPDPYLVLHFESVAGEGVGFGATSGVSTNGEGFSNQWYGSTLVSTNVSSTAALSGIQMHNRVMFLVGVFLGPALPTTAPAVVDYTNLSNQLDFRPALGQTFFIGDGFTDTRVQQNFYVPTGASRLYLGFADSWNFDGPASWYSDNHGRLSANLSIDPVPAPTPDPATVWLLGLPLAGIWYRARRRRA